MIIVIDNEVIVNEVYDFELITQTQKIKSNNYYHPGFLSFKEQELQEKVKTYDDSVSLYLTFSYTTFCQNKKIDIEYKVDFFMTWFKYPYIIIKIYNISERTQQRFGYPAYIYDTYTSGGAVLRAKPPKIRKKNKCWLY